MRFGHDTPPVARHLGVLLVTLSQLTSVRAVLNWGVVGDSWSSGVAYSRNNGYDSNVPCGRAKEAWGALMAADTSWQDGGQKFDFAACGGTKMAAAKDQFQKNVGPGSLLWSTFGGNDADFGAVARACIFQPLPGGWGKPWDEDPNGEGECKKNIKAVGDYLDDPSGFRKDFSDNLDGLFAIAQDDSRKQDHFDMYISSYVPFFNVDTDDCDNWSFGHPWVSSAQPKLVKGLRQEVNDKTSQVNNIQADVIKSYKVPAPSKPNYRVHNVQPSPEFNGHRFCEVGHSFDDQFYSPDVWLWNLQYWDTQSEATTGKNEAPKTVNGVTFMDGTGPAPESGPVMGIMSNPTPAKGVFDPGLSAQSGSGGSGVGWTARPFHPKEPGYTAMKNLFIKTMQDDKIPGVKGGAAGSSTTTPPAPPPSKPTEVGKCFGLGAKKYVGRDTIADIIQKQYCPDAVKQGKLDANSASIARTYNKGTPEEVSVSIDYKPGLDFKPNMDDCVRLLLGRDVDGCDGNDPKNPLNWKGGGQVMVNGQIRYAVTPQALRQPTITKVGGGCDSTYDFLFNAYTVWGAGFDDTDHGDALQNQLHGCALLPDTWSFDYGLGSDGREWTAKFRTGVFQKSCVGHAIGSAGGPGGCSGSG